MIVYVCNLPFGVTGFEVEDIEVNSISMAGTFPEVAVIVIIGAVHQHSPAVVDMHDASGILIYPFDLKTVIYTVVVGGEHVGDGG